MKSNRYWALLDACNDAATLDRFELAYAQLEGYRQALDDFGHGWSPLADDCYTKTKYGDKPMTCGILHHNFEEQHLMNKPNATFKRGDLVRKKSGGSWRGVIVGEYSTSFTPEGYVVESAFEVCSVQIYPVKALEPWIKNATK